MKNLNLVFIFIFLFTNLNAQDITVNADGSLNISGQVYRTIEYVTGPGQPSGIDSGPVPGRELTFTKKYNDTKLRVSYSDHFRVNGAGKACRWEVYFNGLPCSQPGRVAYDVYVDSGNTHRPATVLGYCESTSAGSLDAGDVIDVNVLVSNSPGYSGSDCYTGWQSDATWLLEVEEVR